jgi:nitrous oxide reductase accessory protein NosL
MRVENHPDWAAAVSYRDGRAAWFDGPKDLFTYLQDPMRYGARKGGPEVAAIQVKDYYGLKAIDARKAFFVLGSDVMGPMGRELIPFAAEADAREFMKDHRGRRVLAFREITPTTLKELE